MSLREKYAALAPETKKKLNIAIVLLIGAVILTLMYYASGASKKRPAAVQRTTVNAKNFTTKEDRNTSLLLGIDKKFSDVLKRVEELENRKADLTFNNQPYQAQEPVKVIAAGETDYRQQRNSSGMRYPQEENNLEFDKPKDKKSRPTETIISGIDYISISVPQETEQKKSNPAKVNYVPSNSIFKAVLLTGVYAKTSAQGKANPTPVIFRLTDLSFFPNEVRRNLAGCYVGGEAHAELSDERVHTRLTSFSCITSDRKQVVDIPVTGRVQGGDGSVGIAGKVISKQEAALLLAGVSGFIEGGAEGFSAANSTQNVNVFGTSEQTYTDDQIARNAIGKGVGKSAGVLTDFFEDLLQEIKPVIHAQGGQEVELIISKGFSLELEDWQWTGIKY